MPRVRSTDAGKGNAAPDSKKKARKSSVASDRLQPPGGSKRRRDSESPPPPPLSPMLSKRVSTGSYSQKDAAESTKKDSVGPLSGIFDGKRMFFVRVELPRARRELLEKRVEEQGADVLDKISLDQIEASGVDFILVDGRVGVDTLWRTLTQTDKLDNVETRKKIIELLEKQEKSDDKSGFKFVRACWISECLNKKAQVDLATFKINTFLKNYLVSVDAKHDDAEDPSSQQRYLRVPTVRITPSLSPSRDLAYQSDDDHKSTHSDFGDRSDNEADDDHDSSFSSTQPRRSDSGDSGVGVGIDDRAALLKRNNIFLSAASGRKSSHGNEALIEQLEELQKTYRNLGDQFRGYAYGRAISAIRGYPHKIRSIEQIRDLKNVGPRIAGHIKEILDTGHCEKIDQLTVNDEEARAMNTFVNIHGVGTKTAQKWVQLGYRTLDDVKQNVKDLTVDQKTGLKYYDEFLQKMPRSEVEEIVATVQAVVNEIKPGFIFRTCGSYIRGRDMCGDVDLLMTHPDGVSHEIILRPTLARLHETGFLVDDLWLTEGRHKKYFGVCILPRKGALHRRLDIIIPPFTEWATCVLGWSGSMYFVRSIRDLANKKNMSLTDYELRRNVSQHDHGKAVDGEHVDTPTEEAIFQALDFPFLRPEERDH